MVDRLYSILVLEDNPADARLIQEAFRNCSYRCQITLTEMPAHAERLLATDAFDLLLSDFGTNTQTATEFLRTARRLAPLLPIVVLSGTVHPNPAYQAGANAFVRKPGDLQEFFTKIQSVMNFWVNVAQLPYRPESARSCDNSTCPG